MNPNRVGESGQKLRRVKFRILKFKLSEINPIVVKSEHIDGRKHHCHVEFNDGGISILYVRGQVRSGVGAYGGAARRRVLLRPPSGHRPDRRQARHVHILQIDLRLAIAQTDARPVMPISFR